MNNKIIKITGLLLLIQLAGCSGMLAPKPSPEASPALVAEALRADSNSKVAKLYIAMEDRDGATNLKFTINEISAGEIGADHYLYLKFDEGKYKIVSEINNAVMSISEKGEINYLAKPGSVDIISCRMLHFMPESKFVKRTPEFDTCQIRPFDKNTAKIKDMSLRVGDVSHFGEGFRTKPTEYEFFKRAKMENTIAAYQKYLKNYPNGEYIKSAKKGIEILKWEE